MHGNQSEGTTRYKIPPGYFSVYHSVQRKKKLGTTPTRNLDAVTYEKNVGRESETKMRFKLCEEGKSIRNRRNFGKGFAKKT